MSTESLFVDRKVALTHVATVVFFLLSICATGCWFHEEHVDRDSPVDQMADGMNRGLNDSRTIFSSPPGLTSLADEASQSPTLRVKEAFQRGGAWLLNQQGVDGAWHSQTYGVMRGGVGLTALALDVLSRPQGRQFSQVDHSMASGVRFLKSHVDEFGLVTGDGNSADYPVHATALLLHAISRSNEKASVELKQKLISALQKSQRVAANGWNPSQRDFGGWAALNDRIPSRVAAANPGAAEGSPSNVSITRHVLSALSAAGGLTPRMAEDTSYFLDRCRVRTSEEETSYRFYFTPDPEDLLNKEGYAIDSQGRPQAKAYATATWDGLLAVRFSDLSGGRHQALVGGFREFPHSLPFTKSTPSGEELPGPDWDAGLDFYEAAQWAELRAVFGDAIPSAEWGQVVVRLLELQRMDGSWASRFHEMREDDPLIATPFALMALGQWLAENEDVESRNH